MICSPSFLSSDFSKLESEIKSINKARWLHFDVMDGKFVKNKTYNHMMLKAVSKYSQQVFDTHLMIEEPEKHFLKYANNGADIITFHLEATNNPQELIKKIKDENVMAGISIKPDTSPEELDPYLSQLDLILIMSVEPGKGGQDFIPSSLKKIKYFSPPLPSPPSPSFLSFSFFLPFSPSPFLPPSFFSLLFFFSFLFPSPHLPSLLSSLSPV
ncbi:MAG: ribulose-phosphate 3-epimerase, partial [Bacillota bacterium]